MRIFLCLLVSVSFFVSCKQGKNQSQVNSASEKKSPLVRASKYYAMRCASCHGPTGKGNGPVARSLSPKPRNMEDTAWQSATSDQAIKDILIKGGAGVGKSPFMPPNPDLRGDEELVKGLISIIRSFKK